MEASAYLLSLGVGAVVTQSENSEDMKKCLELWLQPPSAIWGSGENLHTHPLSLPVVGERAGPEVMREKNWHRISPRQHSRADLGTGTGESSQRP